MAKFATDDELAVLITSIVQQAHTDNDLRYRMFLETIAEAVGAYHAVEIGTITPPSEDMPDWTVSIYPTVDTAMTSSPFGTIDPDVTMNEWHSIERQTHQDENYRFQKKTKGDKDNREQKTATATV